MDSWEAMLRFVSKTCMHVHSETALIFGQIRAAILNQRWRSARILLGIVSFPRLEEHVIFNSQEARAAMTPQTR